MACAFMMIRKSRKVRNVLLPQVQTMACCQTVGSDTEWVCFGNTLPSCYVLALFSTTTHAAAAYSTKTGYSHSLVCAKQHPQPCTANARQEWYVLSFSPYARTINKHRVRQATTGPLQCLDRICTSLTC